VFATPLTCASPPPLVIPSVAPFLFQNQLTATDAPRAPSVVGFYRDSFEEGKTPALWKKPKQFSPIVEKVYHPNVIHTRDKGDVVLNTPGPDKLMIQ